jgi:hypothetical protein
MTEGFPKVLRSLYRSRRAWAFYGFTVDDAVTIVTPADQIYPIWLRNSINCDHIVTNQLVSLPQINSVEADFCFRFPFHDWSNI